MVTTAAVLTVVPSACASDDDVQSATPAAGGEEPPTGEWVQAPQSPLEPRSEVVGVWTGDDVMFVGGSRFLCPPGADCSLPDEPPFANGAIFDLDTATWRSIEPAPIGNSSRIRRSCTAARGSSPATYWSIPSPAVPTVAR